MFGLFRYLGKYGWIFVLAIVLAAGQAICELQLPGQMSQIVSVGIQGRGIEDSAPERITRADFESLLPFMRREGSEDRQAAQKAYAEDPANPDILVRRQMGEKDLARLDSIFSRAEWAAVSLFRELPKSAGDPAASFATQNDLSDIDAEAVCAAMPELGHVAVSRMNGARAKASAVPDALREQTGAAFAALYLQNAGADPAALQRTYLFSEGARMALFAAFACVFAIGMSTCAARAGAALGRSLRSVVHDKAVSLSQEDVQRFTEASLLSRTTNDVTLVQSFTVSFVRIMIYAGMMGIGGAFLAGARSTALAWSVGGAVVAIMFVILLIFAITRPRYRIIQRMIDRLNTVTRESVQAVGPVRAAGAQAHEEARYDDANSLLADTQLGINRILSFLSPSFTIVINAMSLVIVWLGAKGASHGMVEIGEIIAYVQYGTIVVTSFVLIAGMFVIVPRVSIAAERIRELLATDVPQRKEEGATHVVSNICLENVTFRYPGRKHDAVSDVTLKAPAGQVTAILGEAGSGKTTLLELLCGYRDPQSGIVSAGGKKTRSGAELAAIESPAFSPERPLFFRTAEGGVPVAIRFTPLHALSQKAGAYILDAPFAATGRAHRGELLEKMRAAAKEAPVVYTAARAENVRGADRIVVLEAGKVTACGTHAELLAASETYRRFVREEEGDGCHA